MPKTAKTPGSVLKAKIDLYELTIADVAKALKVKSLDSVVSGKEEISLDLALRLAKFFGGKPEEWIKLQLTASKKKAAAELKGIKKAKKPAKKPGRKAGGAKGVKKAGAKKPGRAAKDVKVAKKPGRKPGAPKAAVKKPVVRKAKAKVKVVKVTKNPPAPKPLFVPPVTPTFN
ncbi:hypothetical protein AGMMS49928_16570 [Spirochaetia bacterium]|nr:hypothetical protein AGMMS49928_16570 [Spirochaetia bacterium]